MRVIVFGTSGSGKSTFAAALGQARRIPYIELDLINWLPGWLDRNKIDPDGFIADVDAATTGPDWVCTGGYGKVRTMLWTRATDVVYLDIPRHLIMRQVIGRSLKRIVFGGDVFPGCKEDWRRVFMKEHPIRIAWTSYHRRRETLENMVKDPAFAHLRIHRCHSLTDVAATLTMLSQT